ncbi:hypothetical protein J3R30DRAFT_3835326 [Lentinula aciculospora]|uniref:BRCT domain-containing protein n=1 Tax=Lentinula aciculospora TaxID=153920 RepID=A0A9W9AJX4_9AGAR|nr:hypothetical protein J3R30DRAFT_3835326 [Lentinula aciculospora]
MAPARSSVEIHRGIVAEPSSLPPSSDNDLSELFLDPMLGTPLAMYVEKDVQDRDVLVDLITKHGGSVSPGYSGVPYILVDPLKPSGQNLYRQYASKKGKIILHFRWVHECIKACQLQTFQTNWAGCKVTGAETALVPTPSELLSQTPQVISSQSRANGTIHDSLRRRDRQTVQVEEARQIVPPPPPPAPIHPQILHTSIHVDTLVHSQNHFPYQIYTPPPAHSLHSQRTLQTPPPQTWQAPGIAPHQTHVDAPSQLLNRSPYRDEAWGEYNNHSQAPDTMNPAAYDYRYRDPSPWAPATYYDPPTVPYDETYDQNDYVQDSRPDPPEPTTEETESLEKTRGRKRVRASAAPATPASALVVNRNPPARSPTPPSRTVKSTYGGNLFTAEDVFYLKKYIDYCQDQGLVLSLREICERIAVKAPHHTFYSWRRYCNKHQIRLGGYAINADRSQTLSGTEDEEERTMQAGPGPGTIAAAQQRLQAEASSNRPRSRSPTPPKTLFRSTTGKGVSFTDEDVTFLMRYMEYRKSEGSLDMVAFWKEVATKAPHHSRASWMKFWRRHKHELQRSQGDDPLPLPPDKKLRYSRGDDVLLAKYFCNKPDGTSDKIFQTFARLHPHHPWKGWQEHHRIHKAKIDHFIENLKNGDDIDEDNEAAT